MKNVKSKFNSFKTENISIITTGYKMDNVISIKDTTFENTVEIVSKDGKSLIIELQDIIGFLIEEK